MSEEITLTKEKLAEIINYCFTKGILKSMMDIRGIGTEHPFSKHEYFKQIINECENPQYTNERNEK
jgi:hypothetical protein